MTAKLARIGTRRRLRILQGRRNPELMVMLNRGRHRNPRHVMDAETVHNWTSRYAKMPHYADLSAAAKQAAKWAHEEHQKGVDAGDLARFLTQKYPAEFSRTGRNPAFISPSTRLNEHTRSLTLYPSRFYGESKLQVGKRKMDRVTIIGSRNPKHRRSRLSIRRKRKNTATPRYDLKYRSGGHGGPYYGAKTAIKQAKALLKGLKSRDYETITLRRYTPSGFTPEYEVSKSKGEGITYKHVSPYSRNRSRRVIRRIPIKSVRKKLSPKWRKLWAGLEAKLAARRGRAVSANRRRRRNRGRGRKLLR